MKKNILITGRPRVGKTMLIKYAAEKLGDRAGGFYTEEIRGEGVRGRIARNEARLLAVYLLARHSAMTQREIGRLFGGVSDVAISNSARLCEEKMKENKSLRKNCEKLMGILKIS